jgi:hypothetical protein
MGDKELLSVGKMYHPPENMWFSDFHILVMLGMED